MQEWEKAYAAGLMDGEGSFHIGHQTPTGGAIAQDYQPQVQCTMADLPPIQFLLDRWGGKVINKKPHGSNKKPVYYHWYLRRGEMASFIEDILPYLLIKRDRAELLITYINSRTVTPTGRGSSTPPEETQRRYEFYRQMKVLNGKEVVTSNS